MLLIGENSGNACYLSSQYGKKLKIGINILK
jgi:hypothetical protein